VARGPPACGNSGPCVGAGTKAGGPNYLAGLGEGVSKASTARENGGTAAHPGVRRLEEAAHGFLSAAELEPLQRALASDAAAWATELGTAKDVSGLGVERNIFRYRPVPVTVRLSEGEPSAGNVHD
jgi:RHH-type proline utilization regulon transcriptional repressor/proline dehydrogenase/delta 1-pyrroline-5-carboxylate dehydrogenase